jgi:hypothetical protein
MKRLEIIETHDLYLRALAVPVAKTKKKKTKDSEEGESNVAYEPKWPDTILAFDTESRITVDQSLMFGVWQRCKLVGENYEVIEEGIFHADDLPANNIKILETHLQTAVSDVQSFPPRFPLYSRSQFMKKVFWRALKRDGAMVVGFNLGYDLICGLCFGRSTTNHTRFGVPVTINAVRLKGSTYRRRMVEPFFPSPHTTPQANDPTSQEELDLPSDSEVNRSARQGPRLWAAMQRSRSPYPAHADF